MVQTGLLPLIGEFLKEDIPSIGPGEDTDIDPPDWQKSETGNPALFPGGGLSRHSMLYVGEGCNKIYLIHDGKSIWTYSTGKGWEHDDIWMLTNGNILFSRMSWAGEVTPRKELVWKYLCEEGTELHSLQPVGRDHVLLLVNGNPPRILLVFKQTGETVWEKVVPCDPAVSVHGQFRRMRYTAAKTYLIPHLSENKVVEYSQDMKELWRYEVKGAWAAVRLKNGNTLITAEGEERTVEVSPGGQIVWELRLAELPPPYRLIKSQSCVRLDNGNTILCSMGNGGRSPQMIEVTPDKEVVWCLKDWKNLGPATSVQILGEPGVPEVPGDCQR